MKDEHWSKNKRKRGGKKRLDRETQDKLTKNANWPKNKGRRRKEVVSLLEKYDRN